MNVLVIYLDRTKINKNGQNHTKTGKIIQCYITGLIDLVWGKPQKWEKFNLKTNQKRGKIEKTKVEARCVCEELGRFIFRQQLAVVGLLLGVSHSCFIAWFVPIHPVVWYLEGWIFLPFSAVGMIISWRSSHMDIRVGNVWTCSCLDLCHVKWKPCYNVFDVLINTVHQETRTTVYFNCVQNSGLKTILQSKGTQSWWGIMDEPKRRRRDPTGILMSFVSGLFWASTVSFFSLFFVLPGCELTWISSWADMGMNSSVLRVWVWLWICLISTCMSAPVYFVFAPPKKPKQQKTVEKEKISVFSLEWNCCGVEDGKCSREQKWK